MTSFKPLVSIVVPMFNSRKYIRETIDSCLEQDFERDYELVIVDDGSTDESLEFVQRLSGEVVKPNCQINVLSQENAGPSVARNNGTRYANSDVVLYLDSEDMIAPTTLSKCYTHFEKDPKCGLVYSDHLKIDENGVVFKERIKNDFTLRELLSGMFVGAVRVFRKSVVEECGYYDESLRYAEDYDLVLKTAIKGYNIVHIPEFLYYYKCNPNSLVMSPGGNDKIIEAGTFVVKRAFRSLGITDVEITDVRKDEQGVTRYLTLDQVDAYLKQIGL